MLFSCSRFIFPRGVQNFHCHCLMSRQDGLNDVAALFERDPFDLCCCLPAKKTGTKENYSFPLSSPPCSSQHFTFFPPFRSVPCVHIVYFLVGRATCIVSSSLLVASLCFIHTHIHRRLFFVLFGEFFFLCCFSPFHRTTCT